MKQVLYIHGGTSFSQYEQFLAQLATWTPRDLPGVERKKWTERLRADLGPEYEVFMPQMPNSQNAKYPEWKIWFERHFSYLQDGVVLVGCSLGAMFLAKYFSETTAPFAVKALILMAPAIVAEDLGGEDGGDFIVDLEKVPAIATHVPKVILMHSTDDPIVPHSHSVTLQAAIPGSTLLTFTDKNHFLVPELPELVTLLTELHR